MQKVKYFLPFIMLALMFFAQGCDFTVTYDIDIINDTNSSFSVYLDDEFQFKLAAGGSSTIRNVDSGSHLLEARSGNIVVAERSINLDSDLEWTVYTENYELTVCNDTRSYFSFYLDGVYQGDVEAGECIIFTDVSAELHTLEARVGDIIIADDTFDIDEDLEWTVF